MNRKKLSAGDLCLSKNWLSALYTPKGAAGIKYPDETRQKYLYDTYVTFFSAYAIDSETKTSMKLVYTGIWKFMPEKLILKINDKLFTTARVRK